MKLCYSDSDKGTLFYIKDDSGQEVIIGFKKHEHGKTIRRIKTYFDVMNGRLELHEKMIPTRKAATLLCQVWKRNLLDVEAQARENVIVAVEDMTQEAMRGPD